MNFNKLAQMRFENDIATKEFKWSFSDFEANEEERGKGMR